MTRTWRSRRPLAIRHNIVHHVVVRLGLCRVLIGLSQFLGGHGGFSILLRQRNSLLVVYCVLRLPRRQEKRTSGKIGCPRRRSSLHPRLCGPDVVRGHTFRLCVSSRLALSRVITQRWCGPIPKEDRVQYSAATQVAPRVAFWDCDIQSP